MTPRADVVVVGSGFGGAIAAFRYAAAGLGVVLLERGARIPASGAALPLAVPAALALASLATRRWEDHR